MPPSPQIRLNVNLVTLAFLFSYAFLPDSLARSKLVPRHQVQYISCKLVAFSPPIFVALGNYIEIVIEIVINIKYKYTTKYCNDKTFESKLRSEVGQLREADDYIAGSSDALWQANEYLLIETQALGAVCQRNTQTTQLLRVVTQ
jgi:hypothetical protein